MITVGFPVLSRYDLVSRCVETANAGTVKPDKFLIVDNGGKLDLTGDNIEVYRPGYNIGVAASWNYIVKHTEKFRIITNDDIEFASDTIERILEVYNQGNFFVCANQNLCNYSCFGISDELIDKIGLFDEGISPGYAYYEDNDYTYRMKLLGYSLSDANTAIKHVQSATLKQFNAIEQAEHWRKFSIAQANYIRKWGGLPDRETYSTPWNTK